MHDGHHDEADRLIVTARRVTEHRWLEKTIPSGFFSLPGAEHVSAVLFNSGATLSKFNRIGYMAGFGSRRVRMVRTGTAQNHDPDAALPHRFQFEVHDPDYRETWSEGLDVSHNPNARFPLEPRHFPMAAHHVLEEDGRIHSHVPDWHPLASVTQIFVPEDRPA